jgi:hypothetical protein
MRHLTVAAILATALAAAAPAKAAESKASCTGFIDTLPAYVGGGTWCLRKDLNVSLAGESAITADRSNTVIDCNGFRVTNTLADNIAVGIDTTSDSVTVRRCVVRNFGTGIELHGSAPLVEDSRVENSYSGIRLVDVDAWGESGVAIARRNIVLKSLDTGISTWGRAVIEDNLVDGVGGAGSIDEPAGIFATGDDVVVARNTIRGIIDPNGIASGIMFSGFRGAAHDNVVIALPGNGNGIGIFCVDQVTRGNVTSGWSAGLNSCDTSLGDVNLP